MNGRRLLSTLLLFVVAGCGGTGATSPAVRYGRDTGDAHGVPSMAALPDSGDPGGFTEHMRHGLALAQDTFAIDLPPAPPELRGAELQAWSDGPLAEFVDRKSTAVTAARHELDLAAEEAWWQRIVGGAVVGLMYEDAGHALLSIPTPAELASEPDIAEAFRQVIASQASPYVEQARAAFRACAENARIHENEPFATFCDARRRGLPERYESHASDRDRVLGGDEE